MIVSYEHNFLFVHVPKAAGSSIRRALDPYSDPSTTKARRDKLQKWRLFLPMSLLPHYKLRTYTLHMTATRIRQTMPSKIWGNLFKFAFVRNPWDRELSFYRYICRNRRHPQHNRVTQMGSFEAYLNWRRQDNKRLQKRLICDDKNEICVNFVGKYENLVSDFDVVASTLKLPIKLPHLNSGSSVDYRQHYTTSLVDLVSTSFLEDIELFGYKFE